MSIFYDQVYSTSFFLKTGMTLIMRLSKLLGTLALGVLLSHVPPLWWAQDFPTLGTQAVNLDSQPIATETTFTSGFSVDTTTFQSDGTIASQQPVTIKGTMTVDPTHVGQPADLIVYLNYGLLDQPLTPETSTKPALC